MSETSEVRNHSAEAGAPKPRPVGFDWAAQNPQDLKTLFQNQRDTSLKETASELEFGPAPYESKNADIQQKQQEKSSWLEFDRTPYNDNVAASILGTSKTSSNQLGATTMTNNRTQV